MINVNNMKATNIMMQNKNFNIAIIKSNKDSSYIGKISNMIKDLFIIGCPIARGMLQKDLETNNNIQVKYYKSNNSIPEFNFNLKGMNKKIVFNNKFSEKLLNKLQQAIKFKTDEPYLTKSDKLDSKITSLNEPTLLIFIEST